MKLLTFKEAYAKRRNKAPKDVKIEDIPATSQALNQNLERIRKSLQLPDSSIVSPGPISGLSSANTRLLAAANLNITTFPTEILLRIFHFLRPPNSVLFGLTCRRFYCLHWSLHGKVKINMCVLKLALRLRLWLISHRNDGYIISDPKVWEWLLLYHFLQQWMGPRYVFNVRRGTLIKKRSSLHGISKIPEGKM